MRGVAVLGRVTRRITAQHVVLRIDDAIVDRFAEFAVDDDNALAHVIDNNAALTVESRAELHELEREFAEYMAEQVTERPMSSSGLDIAARYRSALTTMGMGGDWYEVIDLGPDRVGIAALRSTPKWTLPSTRYVWPGRDILRRSCNRPPVNSRWPRECRRDRRHDPRCGCW